MRSCLIVIFLFASFNCLIYSEQPAEVAEWKVNWPTLRETNLQRPSLGIHDDIRLYLDPSIKITIADKVPVDVPGEEIRLGSIRLPNEDSDWILTLDGFYQGQWIVLKNSKTQAEILGKYFCIPNNGSVYSITYDSLFTKLYRVSKFMLDNGTANKVHQPFNYQNFYRTTNTDIDIFLDIEQTNKIATIAKGKQIHVIGIAEDDQVLLLVSSSGLVGWHRPFDVPNLGQLSVSGFYAR